MSVHFGPLEEIAMLDHGPKRRLVDEVIFPVLLFLAARFARGVRDRHHQVLVQLQQRLDQAGLARAAGRRHDKQVSGVVHGLLDVLHLERAVNQRASEAARPNFISRASHAPDSMPLIALIALIALTAFALAGKRAQARKMPANHASAHLLADDQAR